MHVGVAQRRHQRPVSGATGVQLYVQTQGLSDVGDLQCASDTHIVLRIEMGHVAATPNQERRLLLDTANMLGDQQRGIQPLP